MKTIAIIERGKDGSFGIYTPNLQSTISGNGSTLDEAKTDFKEAYNEVLETYSKLGKSVPAELKDLDFEYHYDLGAFYEAHPYLNVSQVAKYIGINDTLMRQYRRGQYISEAQVARIQDGIHRIGQELSRAVLIR